jgi:hypothetical protein
MAALFYEVIARANPALAERWRTTGVGALTAEERDEIFDELSYELQRSGFEADWEPNKRGLALEFLMQHWHTLQPERR